MEAVIKREYKHWDHLKYNDEAVQINMSAWFCVLRLTALVKDYCGSLSEKSVQMNFALIYELLDEVVVSEGAHHLGFYLSSVSDLSWKWTEK